ncbi:hypothetical protein H6P81_018378 [Aristolochia fimbriata]|uniref:Integrase catalytic domain-containing protein n=1 Tax=Aristolochia fimbriata TaxID=158543 RepID=A0AAV7E2T2_ARIFI|nr:hypothetical protein H6P81_018378 [Aristolochia fimbriata]
MSRPILSGRLAKLALLLSEFKINFVPQHTIKGQALANFLADHSVLAEWELTEEFSDEEIFFVEVLPPWEMYFDGVARRNGAGARVLFISPRRDLLPYSFVLTQNYSNNEAEYQAILLGLGMAVEMKLPQLNIYDDSDLVIKQLTRGIRTDALAGIAASLAQFDERPSQVPICERWVIPPPVEEETEEQTEEIEESLPISASQNEAEDWRDPISNFLRHDILLADLRDRVQIRRAAPKYIFINDVLHRRSYEGLLLRCLSKEEGLQVLKETHGGICGAHQAGPKLHLQVKRLGYYWPYMLRDTTEMARTCKPCQFYADYIHQPREPLHPTIVSWPFEALGMDIIGPITPKSDFDRQYILAAIDYFSKWAEAVAYQEVKATTVADFIQTQIIYRYGVPRYIMTDNGTPFRNRVMDRLSNGLAEAFNKTLCKILKKTIGTNKKSWDEKFGEPLWAYRTSFQTPIQSTPYSLVYGTEAMLPLKVQLPSLRIAMREGLTTEECAQLRLAELESLDEQRLAELESLDEQRLEAQQRLECYQSRMTRAFNKKVRLRSFQKGDLVLAVRRSMLFTSKIGGKFAPKMGRTKRSAGSLHQWCLQTRPFKRFGAANNKW